MPFIGNQPALSYTSFAKQDFTTSATTSYTLDNPVANANELALFINFVRQEPTTAYSASGTSLTLTSATSATDDMYCVFLGKAVQTVNPPNASVGLSQLTATGTKDATTFLRGDNTFAVAGGDNTPAFFAYQTSNQTISTGTNTTVSLDTKAFDTDNAFASNTFTVPVGEGGKYFFTIGVRKNNFTSTRFNLYLENQDTTSLVSIEQGTDSAYGTANGSTIVNLSAGNTVVMKVYHNASGSETTLQGKHQVYFGGYKIIE